MEHMGSNLLVTNCLRLSDLFPVNVRVNSQTFWVQQHREHSVWQKITNKEQQNQSEQKKQTQIEETAWTCRFWFFVCSLFVFSGDSSCRWFFGDSVFDCFFWLKLTFSVLDGIITLTRHIDRDNHRFLDSNVNPGLINHGLLGGYSSNSHNPILKWYPPN